jgi:3-mercaptopyruvate sulfurtransferase SseA
MAARRLSALNNLHLQIVYRKDRFRSGGLSMLRLFVFGTIATLLLAPPAPAAPRATDTPGPLVSTEWLQQHLADPLVRIVATGDEGRYDRGHIPGARFLEHMDTLGSGHVLLPPGPLAAVLAKAGVTDGARVVLYGDSPMTTGWVYMALASVGHAADVSMLDGSVELWRSEGRSVSTTAPPAASGHLTFTRAGFTPGQQIVTYCAVGMRASLMYWAALTAGLPARVYVGSWQDWQRDSSNPVVR